MAGLQDIGPMVEGCASPVQWPTHAGGGDGSLAAGVAAADHDDVERIDGQASNGSLLPEHFPWVKTAGFT